jgi:hypothetical protein
MFERCKYLKVNATSTERFYEDLGHVCAVLIECAHHFYENQQALLPALKGIHFG